MPAERRQTSDRAGPRRRPPATAVAIGAALGVAVLLGPGCAGGPHAPAGWLPTVHQAPFDPYGGWINLQPSERHAAGVSGELLAVSPDSAWVLTVAGPVARSWAAIRSAELVLYDPQVSGPNGWVAAGAAASLSHGFGFVISLPVWLIAGGGSARAHRDAAILKYPEHPWAELRAGARFAGGLPPGLDLTRLAARPRPVDLQGRPVPNTGRPPADPGGGE